MGLVVKNMPTFLLSIHLYCPWPIRILRVDEYQSFIKARRQLSGDKDGPMTNV